MPWWGWIVIGTILFCAELFAVDAQFYFIFVGAGAVVVGLTGLSGLDLPAWGQWLLFAMLSIASMVAFRKKLFDKIRGGVERVSDSVVGETIALAQQLEAGDRSVQSTEVRLGPQKILETSPFRVGGMR